MMELLKRLEQQSQADDSNFLEADDDDVDTDLAQRLDGIDLSKPWQCAQFAFLITMNLDSISSDHLWSILTPEEREKFMRALDNPSSELAQQLLASDVLDSGRLEPWWEVPSVDDATNTLSSKRYGAKPEAMPIPSTLPKVPLTGSPLLYNICALW
jgi:hypothetical protein